MGSSRRHRAVPLVMIFVAGCLFVAASARAEDDAEADSLTARKVIQRIQQNVNSEEGGMQGCAKWLRTFVDEVPVKHLPAGDPFWSP